MSETPFEGDAEAALLNDPEPFDPNPEPVDEPGAYRPDDGEDSELHGHSEEEGGGNWSEGDPVDDGSGLPEGDDEDEDDVDPDDVEEEADEADPAAEEGASA